FQQLLCAGSRRRGANRIKRSSVLLQSYSVPPNFLCCKDRVHVNGDGILHVASIATRIRDHDGNAARLRNFKYQAIAPLQTVDSEGQAAELIVDVRISPSN